MVVYIKSWIIFCRGLRTLHTGANNLTMGVSFWIGAVGCRGREATLDECAHSNFGQEECETSGYAGVVCDDGNADTTTGNKLLHASV